METEPEVRGSIEKKFELFEQRKEIKLEKEDCNTFSPGYFGENRPSKPNSPQDPPSLNFPPRYESSKYYDAEMSIRSRITVINDIRDKLTVAQRTLFKATCFGPWLGVQSIRGNSTLAHLILQTEIFPQTQPRNEMWFDIGGHQVRFGREEFCLITGLRFGSIPDMSKLLSERSDNTFRYRIFPDIPAHKLLRGSDLARVFNTTDFSKIEDLDAVGICLLLLLEVGFMGHQPSRLIAADLLQLVEDLDTWNVFPWCSYIWAATYPQLTGAIAR